MEIDAVTLNFLKQNITPIPIRSPEYLFKTEDTFFFTGSCFSEYFYAFLNNHFFNCERSPFGNTYNPLSLVGNLNRIIKGDKIREEEVFEYKGLVRHFAFHTKISHPDKEKYINDTNLLLEKAGRFLKNVKVIIITLGTAFAYYDKKTGRVVNNCHTLPGYEFDRKLLSIDQITQELSNVLLKLKEKLPQLKIIFTISPVRHLRDNPEENSLSKSVLRCATQNLLSLPDSSYFPSYEIVLDELRDYRFYADDLCHPNRKAVGYIMERFCSTYFNKEAIDYLTKVIPVVRALQHRPDHPESINYKDFILKQEQKLMELKKEYPHMDIPENYSDWEKRENGNNIETK